MTKDAYNRDFDTEITLAFTNPLHTRLSDCSGCVLIEREGNTILKYSQNIYALLNNPLKRTCRTSHK